MTPKRSMVWAGVAAIVLVLATSIGAVAGYYVTGETYEKSQPQYQAGYAAGVVDMLTEIYAGKFLKDGSFNDLSGKILKCQADKKLKQSQVRAAYLTYLQQFPAQKPDKAPSNIFESLKLACQIK
jgi:hypothetical protein